jgi:YVTN family beta-propeller protein
MFSESRLTFGDTYGLIKTNCFLKCLIRSLYATYTFFRTIKEAIMKSRIMCALAAAIFIICFSSQMVNAQTDAKNTDAKSGYHLIKKIELGGEGGWDYLLADGRSRLLYISRSSHVMIMDMDSSKVVGDIPETKGVHGIALAHEFGKGFTSNGRDSSVTIFDLKTFKEIAKVKVEKNPDAIIYDRFSKNVFAFNAGSSSVSVIDAAEGKLSGTISLGGKPEFAVSDGKGMVYANLEDKNEVVAIDSKELKIKSRWSLAPGEGPSGLAMDRKNQRLFSVCENKKMIVLDAATGKLVADVPIGKGTDAAGFDTDAQLAFSSNGEGTLTIVKEDSKDTFSVIENLPTQKGARTMTIDAKTHHIFVATASFGPAPEPTAEHQHPRPPMLPNSFVILEYGK